MNPNYVSKVQEDLDCLLGTRFVIPVGLTKWLSPIVIVPKKNGKLRICVDYKWLNSLTKKDPYPLPFIDEVLNSITIKELYSFLDGFNGYNQLRFESKIKRKQHSSQSGELLCLWWVMQCSNHLPAGEY
jgi:hypothetical protein